MFGLIGYDLIWPFVRGDVTVAAFEEWLYQSPEAEPTLGVDLYLDVISTNFNDAKATADLQYSLSAMMRQSGDCECHSQPDQGFVGLGDWPMDRFRIIQERVRGLWWLHNLECHSCGTAWQVASEHWIYDMWLTCRLSGGSRIRIETYQELLAAAKATGSVFRYHDPRDSYEIPAAICDLARETPGIACSVIEDLLPVDAAIVRQHARMAAVEHALEISF